MSGIFDFEQGGYPPPPPKPRRSFAAGVIVGVQLTLVAIIVLTIFFVSDRRSSLPANVSTSDGRYAPCGVVTEQGVTEHLDAYHARCGCEEDEPCWDCSTMGNRICGRPAVCSDQVIDLRPLRTCVTR